MVYKKGKVMKAFIVLIFIFSISTAGLYLYVRSKIYSADLKLNNYGLSSEIKTEEIDFNFEEEAVKNKLKSDSNEGKLEFNEKKGITNILLIGLDARSLGERSRSDSIIISTIDSINKKIKLTSIMRDSYVDIPKYEAQKINAAYFYGGAQLLMNTIEKNFKIKLDKYIIINFNGFEDVIDALGGIEADVKSYEIKEMNKYIGELRKVKSTKITSNGIQHLDGQQTLAYARIRKVGGGSFERNKRQREVLALLVQKLNNISVMQYGTILTKILPNINTNIEPINFLEYAYTISRFKPINVEGLQIPVTELCEGRIYKGSWVLLMDKEQNSNVLNKFIFYDQKSGKDDIDPKKFRTTLNHYLNKDIK